MYVVGRIVNTHGIKGEVKIVNLSDFDRFFVGSTFYTIIDNKTFNFEIESIRMHKNQLLTKLKGYDNINDVLFLKGHEIYSDEKMETDNDEYYYDELIGLNAVDENNNYIGKVSSLIEVPQGHILEILNKDNKKILIPFVDEFILEVNDSNIRIKVIEGLI